MTVSVFVVRFAIVHDELKEDIQGVRTELRETREELSAKIEAVLGTRPACAWTHADRWKATRVKFDFWKERLRDSPKMRQTSPDPSDGFDFWKERLRDFPEMRQTSPDPSPR